MIVVLKFFVQLVIFSRKFSAIHTRHVNVKKNKVSGEIGKIFVIPGTQCHFTSEKKISLPDLHIQNVSLPSLPSQRRNGRHYHHLQEGSAAAYSCKTF